MNATGPAQSADFGPRERRQHHLGLTMGARVVTDGGMVVHEGAKANAECVLDAMLSLGILDGIEGGKEDRKAVGRSRHEAGMRYRRAFEAAGLQTVQAMDLEGKVSGSSPDIPDSVAQGRKRFNSATRRLGMFNQTAQNVCCFNFAPTSDTGINNTKRALDRLCEEYDL
jgi:hypothetical protein